jgi:hypothetical protein
MCYEDVLVLGVRNPQSIACEDVLVLGVRNPQSIACYVWSLHFQDKA